MKNTVVKACFTAIHNGRKFVTQQDFLDSCEQIRTTREDLKHADYSQVNISGNTQNKEKKYTLSDMMEKKQKNWRKTYLSAVPCEEKLEIGKIVKKAHGLRDSEIWEAVENACYNAYESGAEVVSSQGIIYAIEQVKLTAKKEKEVNRTEEMQEILKQIILNKEAEEQFDKQ